MRGKTDEANRVMVRQTGGDAQKGTRPFTEEGYTPEMKNPMDKYSRVEPTHHKQFRPKRSIVLCGLMVVILLGTLFWPFGGWKSGAIDQAYNPPVGSAIFEISGQKYYMPLPIDRNKERAYAIETPAGIVWSPPPPMTNYNKPAYTHPTEPFSIYLSPKGHIELSTLSATRLYTFPLYAGGAQTFHDLIGIYGAGKFVAMLSSSYTLGAPKNFKARMSVIDISESVKGKTLTPRDIVVMDSTFSLDHSFIAIDKQNETIMFADYIDREKSSSDVHTKLYDIDSGNMQELDIEIKLDNTSTPPFVNFAVNDEERTAEMIPLLSKQWFNYLWYSYQSR